MRKLLKGMSSIDNFVDDIIFYTLTWEQHLQVLKQLLMRLRDANLTVKPIKCFIGFHDLECLGHMVGRTIIKPSPEKVLAIEGASQPITKKQVRSFLGLVRFYRAFIPIFLQIAAALTDLTKKGEANKVRWGDTQQNAFDALKKSFSHATYTQNGFVPTIHFTGWCVQWWAGSSAPSGKRR